MKKYYVNKYPQKNRDYEVHREDCIFLPHPENRAYLGVFTSCLGALLTAKAIYSTANGCKRCSDVCHTT